MKELASSLQTEKEKEWPVFFNLINYELNLVEQNLLINLPVKSSLLSEVIKHIFKAGGKRIRPALCFLVALGTGKITSKHIILAELTELIHTASLIHDDIIDSARLRRGVETINSLWNDKISVISGDYLFAQASVRLGEIENNEIVKIYAKVLSDLCDGEIEQYLFKYNTNISWEYYIQKSTTKTASLFAAACKSAAILNNAPSYATSKANLLGEVLGIAFQIKDDLMDFTSTTKKFGKDVCSDLKEGIITAPTLFALKSSDSRSKQLRNLIESRFNNHNEESIDQAIRLVFELGGCEKAESLARSYITKAKENLSFINNNIAKKNIELACDYILDRN